VVISASHNPFQDNGIKFFDRQGRKLSDDVEKQIEAFILEPPVTRPSEELGRAKRIDTARTDYQSFCLSTVPDSVRLDGTGIVIDCSHGAGYKVGPRVLSALGAELVPIGCSPNGRNINAGCGSTHPGLLQTTVRGVGADLGIALDGDGDRVLMTDHEGNLVDGDQLLYVIASARKAKDLLKGPVVGTLMSNLGLEQALTAQGISFQRAQVGDRYVLELLQREGGQLGGESSGHIVCLDKTTTGDGIVSALQVLTVIQETGRTLADLVSDMPKFPQTLLNVRTSGRVDLDEPSIRSAVEEVEEHLAERGRVLLRPSGTEPVVRVMVEGEDSAEVAQLAERIAASVREAAAA